MVSGPGQLTDSLLQLSNKEDTVLGFRVHRMLQAEFLQAAQVTVYDYYEPCKHQDLGVERVSHRERGLLRTEPGGRDERQDPEGEIRRGLGWGWGGQEGCWK